MIVIEGPDGSGKTSLKNDLLTRIPQLNPVRRHCDSDGPTTELRHWVDRDLGQIPQTADLYDRHPLISEPIYGPVIRGSVNKGFDDPGWYLTAWGSFLAQKPIIIFCQPPLSHVITNCHNSYQMRGVNGVIPAIYYGYHYLNLQMKVQGYKRIITWDYTRQDKAAYFHMMVQVINGELV